MTRQNRSLVATLLITLPAAFGSAMATAAPAPEAWSVWDASDPDSTRTVDHGAWQALLDAYLITTDDGRTLFRYGAVSSADRTRLDDYLMRLAGLDPRSLPRAEQFAYWVNLYNALTVRVVLDHPDDDSIRQMGGGWFGGGPWRDKLVTIAGERVSLDDIEHRILRPLWNDQRIHYAVNCASISCPNLAARAYTASNTEALLDEGEHDYLNHPRGLQLDGDELRLSSIYDWYVVDFGGDRAGLLAYLATVRPDLAERLDGFAGDIRYNYDWSLNGVE